MRSLISCRSDAVLFDERLALGRLAHALDDRHALERLFDEVVGALAHRLHRGLDRAVRGHHHDLGVGRDLLHARASSSRPLVPGIIRVGQHHLHAVRAHELERGLGAVGREHAHAFALEDLLERGDVGRLVVDDEDRRRIGRYRYRLRLRRIRSRRFVKHSPTVSRAEQFVKHT